MELNQTIAWIDTETTGTDDQKDRIVQFAGFVTDLQGNILIEPMEVLINPGIPIPAESTEVHGITDEMVANASSFREEALGIFSFLNGRHIGGYNALFDIKITQAELDREKLEWDVDDVMIFDPLRALTVLEPRDQSSMYKYYTGKELQGAHDAKTDILATFEIAKKQIEKYDSITCLTYLYTVANQEPRGDINRKIIYKDGVPVFNFSPEHFGKPIHTEVGFLKWILKKDFPSATKNWITKYMKKNGIT